MANTSFKGPLFDIVDAALRDCREYRDFRAGRISRAAFCRFLDRMAPVLIGLGVPENDVHFTKRYPRSAENFVQDALEQLVARGVLPTAAYDHAAYRINEEALRCEFDHDRFGTYIYPEESRLLFAIADILRPRCAVFLGSYYGYWAAWAVPAMADDGRAILVDPDPAVAQAARRNLAARRYRGRAEIVAATGEEFLAGSHEQFDLVVIDAELPRTHPDPAQRGKGIYGHLLRASLPRLAQSATLVCHNILLRDHSGDAALERILARNAQELGPFMRAVAEEFPNFTELHSTEGVGVGVRRAH